MKTIKAFKHLLSNYPNIEMSKYEDKIIILNKNSKKSILFDIDNITQFLKSFENDIYKAGHPNNYKYYFKENSFNKVSKYIETNILIKIK